ncbi:MAG TPA: hypothetical protein VF789_10150 [Thermoanaerobaculia bacterium]
MNGWDVSADTPLEAIFTWCSEKRGVDRLLLSARLDKEKKRPTLLRPTLSETVDQIFGDHLLSTRMVKRWPGTELYGHKGVVFLVAFDPTLISSMAQVGTLLSNWRHNNNPPLPEDPCLFRQGDEWPVLVTVTHERDAWILSDERPPFCSGEPFVFKPDNLLVPPASEGFVGP